MALTVGCITLFGDSQRVEASLQMPADKDGSRSVGQSSINQLGPRSLPGAGQDQLQPRLETDDWEPLQPSGRSLQLGMYIQ